MTTGNLEDAVAKLAEREKVKADIERDIGRWKLGDPCEGQVVRAISTWAVQHQLDAVVWTALPYKIDKEQDQIPCLEQVMARLREAEKNKLEKPREYIEKAPRQIDTDYRRAINSEFGWTCISDI